MANYITLADVRAAGLDSATADDAAVNAAIPLWQQILERACRQWFEPRTITAKLDGNNTNTLHLPIPVISVSSLKINDSTTALATSEYRVYNGRAAPNDDRANPRIALVAGGPRDIFTAPLSTGRLRFAFGRQNQEVVGSFGFTEPDGSVPFAIKRALTKLVIEKLTVPVYTPAGSSPPAAPTSFAGVVIMEQTDGHMMQYAQPKGGSTRDGLSGITDDPEILKIITMYRAPRGIASPADNTWD